MACKNFTQGSPASVPAALNTLAAPTTVVRPDQVVADTLTFYDEQTTFSTTFPQTTAPTKGNVTMVRQAVDASTYQTMSRKEYDTVGRVAGGWDANGNKTTTGYTMNTAGLMVGTTVTNALNQSVTSTFATARGSALTVTDPNGVVTTETYDGLGRLTAVWHGSRPTSQPANLVYTYAVSNTGVTAVTTKRLLEGGGAGYLSSVLIYDAQLRPRQSQTAALVGSGRVVSDTFYDSRGWVRATNNEWSDPANAPDPTAIASATGLNRQVPNQDQTTYDGLGRVVVSTKLKKGVFVASATTVYNGDKTTTIPPTGGAITTVVTDKSNRAIEFDVYTAPPTVNQPANPFTGIWTVTGGTKTATTYGYDNRGNQDRITDAQTNSWTKTFNLLGRQIASSNPTSGSSTMKHDANGNVTEVTDGRPKTRSFTHDALNRRVAQYDAAKTAQSSSNQTFAWVYDNSNSVPGVTHAVGQLTTEIAYVNGAAYSTQQTDFNVYGESLGFTVHIPGVEGLLAGDYVYGHTYTSLGLPLKDIFPGGNGLPAETVLHTYTTTELPKGLGGLTAYANSTAYDEWGRPNSSTMGAAPNQSFLTTTYDEHTGLVVNQKLTRQTGTPATVDEEAYTYDRSGNPIKQVSTRYGAAAPSETQCFAYDQMVRLTDAWTATDGCAVQPTPTSRGTVGSPLGSNSTYWTAWTVDEVGNRTKQIRYGAVAAGDITTNYTYDGNGANQPYTLTGTTTSGAVTGSTSYGYDKAGNTLNRNAGQGAQSLTWSNIGRLTKVTGGTAGPSDYVYDAAGGLLLQKDPGSTVLYLPQQQLTLNTTTGTVTGTRYYALPGGGSAVRTGTAATAVTFQLSDQHGTPSIYLNYTGQTVGWRQSTPFGDPRGTAVAAPDNHGFLNKPTNVSTGLTAVGARHYDPAIGRFVSVDPARNGDPQQLGGYAYAANNPVSLSDPSGACPADRCIGYGQNPGQSTGTTGATLPAGSTGDYQPDANPSMPWLSKKAPQVRLKNWTKAQLDSWLDTMGCQQSSDQFTNADAMACAAVNPEAWMHMCVEVYGSGAAARRADRLGIELESALPQHRVTELELVEEHVDVHPDPRVLRDEARALGIDVDVRIVHVPGAGEHPRIRSPRARTRRSRCRCSGVRAVPAAGHGSGTAGRTRPRRATGA